MYSGRYGMRGGGDPPSLRDKDIDLDDWSIEMIHPDTGEIVDLTPLLTLNQFGDAFSEIMEEAVRMAIEEED